MRPVVAIVGAPNVGKSTLVNRVLQRRQAVTSEEPGTTRDRTYSTAEWAGREFTLADTGGMDTPGGSELERAVREQARAAVREADVIVHLADARLGVTKADDVVARELRRAPGRVILAVNKLDNPADDTERYQFYSLGEGEPHPVSSLHGIGVGDLLDEVVSVLPESGGVGEESPPAIAIIGRPNVGKSTLLNQILGSQRAVVSGTPGTTTDAVAAEFDEGGQRYVLLDTAGVRRQRKRERGARYYSTLRTEEAIRRAEVSLLLVDGVEGLTGGDLKIATLVEEYGGALGVLVNKRDLIPQERIEEIEADVYLRLTDLKPSSLAISALTGRNAGKVIDFAARLYEAYDLRVPTPELNDLIGEMTRRTPPPGRVKVRYAAQTGQSPPRFDLFCNRPHGLAENYVRYLENGLRECYDLGGVSIKFRLKSS